MVVQGVILAGGFMNLQATLSASTATDRNNPAPHHPITCTSQLALYDDGTFSCEHATVPADDARTQAALDHSVAILLVELAAAL